MIDNSLITSALASVNSARDALLAYLKASTAKKPVGMNLAGASWYAPRQVFANVTQGGQWNIAWAIIPSDQLDAMGYPKNWQPTVTYQRLMPAPSGGWVKPTRVVCTWKGSGNLAFSAARNLVRGDHTMTFDIPAWGGTNMWFGLNGVDPKDPFRDFVVRDADPANATTHQFSKEIVDSCKKYSVLRFMDWNVTNSNPVRSWSTRPNPLSLDRPAEAIENQFALAKLADADPWFNHSWNDDASYIAGAAKYAHDVLPEGRKVYVELSNEVWNWSFPVTHLSADEGMALKLDTNRGYAGLLNYSRRAIAVMKVWKAAFADRPQDLVCVLGTQAANQDVTRLVLKYPGAVDTFDAIALAPYFYSDNKKPYSDALLKEGITQSIASTKATVAKVRELAPKMRVITYEGGQHLYVNDLFPLEQMITVQRSQVMGDAYTEYLTKLAPEVDLITLFNDVGQITKFGAWGQVEYSGQTDAPKQIAVDNYLAK